MTQEEGEAKNGWPKVEEMEGTHQNPCSYANWSQVLIGHYERWKK